MKALSLVLLFFPGLLLAQRDTMQFVGSKNSNKYHYESCQWAQKISETNLVTFKDAKAAVDAGYVACKVCKPPPEGVAVPAVPSKKSNVKEQSSSSSSRCAAITKKGTQCKRKAKAGSAYCWQHGG